MPRSAPVTPGRTQGSTTEQLTALLKNTRALFGRQIAALPLALVPVAAHAESEAQATTAYRGMSGATRASTVAYVATPKNNGESAFDAAYVRAVDILIPYTGHDGQPHGEYVRLPGDHAAYVVLTVPTDYIQRLELDNAGQKAFLLDSILPAAVDALETMQPVLAAAWNRAQ